MAKILDLINAIEGNSVEYNEFIFNLLTDNADLPITNEDRSTLESSIITKINTYLNRADTRLDGLNIIARIIKTCSKDMLAKYGIMWMTKATQVLENDGNELTLTCKVLGNLLILCKKIPELQKEISMHNVKQLILIITKMNVNDKGSSILYPLIVILYYYKESSEKFQATIKDFILQVIDSDDRGLVQAAANCYSVLVRTSERSFKAPSVNLSYTCWTYHEALICNSLHALMDQLFSDSMDLDSVEIWGSLELKNIPEDNIFSYYFGLERRFKNLCIYLSTMLRGCGGRNSVCVGDILKVLCRGLAITPVMFRKDDTFKNKLLVIILPKIHIELMNVLNALIKGFSCQLIPFANIILKLYVQCLKWINNPGEKQTISGNKPFVNIKISVYTSLSLWVTSLGRNSGIEMISQEILPFIFDDITPEKSLISLTVQKNQHISKKALKRSKNAQYENSAVLGNVVDNRDPLINADLCKEALCVFKNIFYNTGQLMTISLYQKSQELIVSLLYDTYLEKEKIDYYKRHAECRINLLKALGAIIMNPHPKVPLPTSYAIQLFNFAIKDDVTIIRDEARLCLAELEKIIHPSAPPLDFPPKNQSVFTENSCIPNNSVLAQACKPHAEVGIDNNCSQDAVSNHSDNTSDELVCNLQKNNNSNSVSYTNYANTGTEVQSSHMNSNNLNGSKHEAMDQDTDYEDAINSFSDEIK